MAYYNNKPEGKPISIFDEGVFLNGNIASLDFVGSSVTASVIGDAATITITGGGGTPTLTEHQIAFGDASNLMTSSSDFIYDTSNGIFSVSFSSNNFLNLDSGNGLYQIGDISGVGNSVALHIEDINSLSYITNASFGVNTNAPTRRFAIQDSGNIYQSFQDTGVEKMVVGSETGVRPFLVFDPTLSSYVISTDTSGNMNVPHWISAGNTNVAQAPFYTEVNNGAPFYAGFMTRNGANIVLTSNGGNSPSVNLYPDYTNPSTYVSNYYNAFDNAYYLQAVGLSSADIIIRNFDTMKTIKMNSAGLVTIGDGSVGVDFLDLQGGNITRVYAIQDPSSVTAIDLFARHLQDPSNGTLLDWSTVGTLQIPVANVTINAVPYFFPNTQAAGAGYTISNDGVGNLTWVPAGAAVIAIGSAVTSGTPGSILFVDGAGNLAQNNNNFYWNDGSTFLGVGNNNPQGAVHIASGASVFQQIIERSAPAGSYSGLNSGNARFLYGVDANNNPGIEIQRGKTGFAQGFAMYWDWCWTDDIDFDFRIYMADATTLHFYGEPTTAPHEFQFENADVRIINGRHETAKGTSNSSASLILNRDGNYFVTSQATLDEIEIANWQDGSIINIRFDAGCTITHNFSPTAGYAPILLLGGANLTVGANAILTLVYDNGNWYEVRAY